MKISIKIGIMSLIISMQLGCNKNELTGFEALTREFNLPSDVNGWLINLGGVAPVIAIHRESQFDYFDFSDGESVIKLDNRNLPEGRAVLCFIDKSESWKVFQSLFVEIYQSGITRTFVTCSDGKRRDGSPSYCHVPIDVLNDDGQFSDYIILELQNTGEVFDLTRGVRYRPDSDDLILSTCHSDMVSNESLAILVSANNDQVSVGDYVKFYSNLLLLDRDDVFLKLPMATLNTKKANQKLEPTLTTPVELDDVISSEAHL